MLIETVIYHEQPILVFKGEKERILFSAGIKKLKLILENINSIKEFVEKNGRE